MQRSYSAQEKSVILDAIESDQEKQIQFMKRQGLGNSESATVIVPEEKISTVPGNNDFQVTSTPTSAFVGTVFEDIVLR